MDDAVDLLNRLPGAAGHPLSSWRQGTLLIGLALLAACGKGETEQKRQPPLVSATKPATHVFRDEIQAVGTARANEQVTLAANVTERIERLMFDDGMFVRSGQLLAVLSNAQEQAALAGARASATEAASQLDRVNSLYEQGFATRALLDQQRAALSEARASQDGIKAQLGDRLIRAPFSGYLSLRTISEGAIVNSGTPLVTISDLSRIKLDFTVPETQLGALRIGQPIRASSSAYPDDVLQGTISTIDPVIDPASRAVMVRATLPNPGARIKPGMLLTVRIETGQRTALAVPESAVLSQGDRRYVYTLDKDRKAKRMDVRTGLRDNGLMEVSGLPQDALVVSEGVVKVAEGRPVRLAEVESSNSAQTEEIAPKGAATPEARP
ncbi:efflux RND transporter periplasmic adaptor subunit [Sphingobium sp. B8D3D]|uniref:efflux RND transporter periplasmic adaptor subunit n=1 Tax=Sphingobium sp. B8D3D TaxID=2940587 RepID=UPI0022248D7B|nr:efflux RND transporter periplasmic adaptor subunit [Sphingobium sp. B8D3D]